MHTNSVVKALKWGQFLPLGSEEPGGEGEETLLLSLERWAGFTYTEQVGGTFLLSHQVSKDLVCARRLESRVCRQRHWPFPGERWEPGNNSEGRLEPALSGACCRSEALGLCASGYVWSWCLQLGLKIYFGNPPKSL